jgi:hypothetical protein
VTTPEPLLSLANAAGAAAALLAQALPDTIVTVAAGGSSFQRLVQTLQGIASVVIALALIAMAVVVIPAAWNTRVLYKRMNEAVERFRVDLDPILRHAVAVGDNVNYISTSIRTDVQMLNDTLTATNRRLNHAAALAEARVNDFNALLQVVQEEAESLFINTASTVRGVQAGAEQLRRFQTGEAALDEGWDDEEMDALAGAYDDEDDAFGYDDEGDEPDDDENDDDAPRRRT